jgi:3-hydroxyisobutyrate dehydrogenase-like beta-hydroxyacid dehydrogenase
MAANLQKAGHQLVVHDLSRAAAEPFLAKGAVWVNSPKPVLDAMGDQAAYIDPIGAGTIAKLVHNCTSAVMGVALAEVFTMGIKAGEV